MFGKLLTAMVTPFDAQGEVDYKRTAELADMLIATGTEGIVVTGTTGESPTLTHDEEFKLYKTVKDVAGNRANVIAGTGSNSTATTIASTKMAEEIGVDGAMIVVPYYNKPSQSGMLAHFGAIADNTKLPMIIYNIPGRTGINMLPETAVELAKTSNYVAYKAASGNLEQIKKVIAAKPDDFVVYSGDDGLTLDILKAGGHGVISVASHIAGNDISAMIKAFVNGNVQEAEALNNKLADLFKVLFITANPTPVKAALEMTWKSVGGLRLPLIDATQDEREQVKKVLDNLG
jgi:4-hydroxy-tetrahydrodipicolinate synthase